MSEALPDARPDTEPAADAAPPTAPGRPPFDVRARAVETGVLVASVVVLRLLGVLLLMASSGGYRSLDVLLPIAAMVLDPNLLVWVVLVAAVQFGLRSMRRPGRWALVVLAAPVAVCLTNVVRYLPDLADAGILVLLGSGVSLIDAGVLTAVVALAVAFTSAALGRESSWSAAASGGLLALGGMLTLVLVWQSVTAYLSFGGPAVITPEQGDRYLVTASLTALAFVGAVVFAIVSRRRGLIITAGVIGCLGLIVAFAAQVPAGRFIPDAPPSPAGPHYAPCYGEGDPNCIGG